MAIKIFRVNASAGLHSSDYSYKDTKRVGRCYPGIKKIKSIEDSLKQDKKNCPVVGHVVVADEFQRPVHVLFYGID